MRPVSFFSGGCDRVLLLANVISHATVENRECIMSSTLEKDPPLIWHPIKEPFYGWRYISRVGPNGEKIREEIQLTLEDVLHPQEGDDIAQNNAHEGDVRYLSDVFHVREHRLDRGHVIADCLVDWGIPRLKNHAVDIGVFDKLKVQPPDDFGTFRFR